MEPELSGQTETSHPTSKRCFVPVVFDDSHCLQSTETFSACIVSEDDQPNLNTALLELGYHVTHVADVSALPEKTFDWTGTVFVLNTFTNNTYDILRSKHCRILGSPCVLSSAKLEQPLPNTTRAVYSLTMRDTVLCFVGFKSKQTLHHLSSLVHMMGGSIRKDISSSVTHIVAHSATGSNYKVAVGLGLPIMSEEWVEKCWEMRQCDVSATSLEMMTYKLPPFVGCGVVLFGFSHEDEMDMKGVLVSNGGLYCQLGNQGVTHVVISDDVDIDSLPPTPSGVIIVRQQWFWESIQLDACADETLYLAKEQQRRQRKRRLLKILIPTETPLCSVSSSHASTQGVEVSMKSKDIARLHIATELLQTERNFVKILTIIVELFMEPLEVPAINGGQILSHEDIKCIFGNIRDILFVHKTIVDRLEVEVSRWTNTSCIGQIFLGESDNLVRVYPPFVNFFEMSKEALARCDKVYPRFHVFLKANESRAECCRQTLAELLIVPVQRIPRIILLLQDLLKHTEKVHVDYAQLDSAVTNLKVVMSHVNEDKRKAEAQVKMFEILRDVEDCPAIVLSSNRSLILKIDVMDIGNPDKTVPLTLFIFSDSIELAKKRCGNFSLGGKAKSHKHLEFVYHNQIRAVVDFGESKELCNAFGLIVHWLDDPQEKLLAFRLVQVGFSKSEVISQLSKLLASVSCSGDCDQFVLTTSEDVFNMHPKSDSSSSLSLKRAFQGARKRVQRAFSTHRSRTRASLGSASADCIDENDTLDTVSLASVNSSTCVPALTPKLKRPALENLPNFSPDFSITETDV